MALKAVALKAVALQAVALTSVVLKAVALTSVVLTWRVLFPLAPRSVVALGPPLAVPVPGAVRLVSVIQMASKRPGAPEVGVPGPVEAVARRLLLPLGLRVAPSWHDTDTLVRKGTFLGPGTVLVPCP